MKSASVMPLPPNSTIIGWSAKITVNMSRIHRRTPKSTRIDHRTYTASAMNAVEKIVAMKPVSMIAGATNFSGRNRIIISDSRGFQTNPMAARWGRGCRPRSRRSRHDSGHLGRRTR